MADTMVMLQLEHRTYGRLLDLLDATVEALELGREVELELIDLIFEYFAGYPDRCHHPKEDLVFRRLELRDASAATAVGDLLGDHDGLAKLTARTIEQVAESRRRGELYSREVIAAMREFSRCYREHIEAEDEHFIPKVFETLDRDDFDLIDFSMFDESDPLFDAQAEARFSRLRRRIQDAAGPSEEDSQSA
jgi:hemerythrin-like domain-containing protein